MYKKKVEIKKILNVCPGGSHAWVKTNIGVVRKQLENIKIKEKKMPLSKFKAIDIIAIIVIVGGLILKFSGADGLVGTLLTMVVFFYFGKKEVYDKSKERTPANAKTETVEAMIRRIAKEQGVDSDLAVRVARCESGLDPSATNKNSDGSLDRGLFQWNNKWHPEISDDHAFNAASSTISFCKAVKNKNIHWWNATRTCWDK